MQHYDVVPVDRVEGLPGWHIPPNTVTRQFCEKHSHEPMLWIGPFLVVPVGSDPANAQYQGCDIDGCTN
jgi:hypothetical protein